ncbi:MAG: ComEC/Rec2 family competence protein [Candidatus Paceibacterota bacterium]
MANLRKILALLVFGFIGGITFSSFINWALPWVGLFLLLALTFLILFFLFARQKFFLALAIIFVGVILGLIRFNFDQKIETALPDCSSSARPCLAVIVADPDRRDASTRLVIELLRNATSSEPEVVFRKSSRVLAIVDNFTNYSYGDKVELVGKIERPQNFLTDQNTVFDYQNYLLVRGIEQTVYQPKLKIISRSNGSAVKTSLYSLKNNFLANLRRALPEPSASLAGGLILGDKGGLGKKTEDEFRKAGVSHIIVLSGYNITIVAESVLYFFAWLTPAFSWLLSIGSIFLFVLMTGGEAAAVRSAVMGAIALIARRYGRTYDAGVALIVAGFLMVLWNPRLLAFDLGFQLSFLATLGLIYLSPVVEFFINKITGLVRSRISGSLEKRLLTSPAPEPVRNATSSEPEVVFRTGFWSGLKELICTTTGAQLAVYPWLLYKMGNASLIGFIANIFILPPIPIAMFLSFLTGITGFLSNFLSLLISYPTYFFLAYILKMAHIFASLL